MVRQKHLRMTVLVIASLSSVAICQLAGAQTYAYTVLHYLGGMDGSSPWGLIRDSSGAFYGTSAFGGTYDRGTLFKFDKYRTFTVLYNFGSGSDGEDPGGVPTLDTAGNIYVPVTYGGLGAGLVFKIDSLGVGSTLHSFNFQDGAYPSGPLLRDSGGIFYGTTLGGGIADGGTVFQMNANGVGRVLSFFDGADGSGPRGLLARDSYGNLYGTTEMGGTSNMGTVFKIAPDGIKTVLHSFSGTGDGAYPNSGITLDAEGNLFGTTVQGGINGAGIIFKIDTAGVETVFHTFTGTPDGQYPYAALTLDDAGNFYGTTSEGGNFGLGTVFKIDASGVETILHSFRKNRGKGPQSPVILSSDGTIFGTTVAGGRYGGGVIFKLQPKLNH